MSQDASAGVSVTARRAAKAMENVLVKASGLKRRPSVASRANTGRKGDEVGGEPRRRHWEKGEDDRDRQREDGDERAPEVIEKEDDHRAHDEELQDELVPERGHGAVDQLGAVVRDDELDSRRKGAA